MPMTAGPFGRQLTWQLRIVRLVGLAALVVTTVARAVPGPGLHGVHLAVSLLLAAASLGWIWQLVIDDGRQSAGLMCAWLLMGVPGGVLAGLDPRTVAIAFPAVVLLDAGARLPQTHTAALTVLLAGATAAGHLGRPWDNGMIQLLVLVAAAMVGTFRLQYVERAEQNELLLSSAEAAAQERARAATLTERTRIAREIHDIHAHSLAALSVQLNVIDALVESGSDAEAVRPYIDHAQHLTRQGITETRRAIHALRGETLPIDQLLRSVADSYRIPGGGGPAAMLTGVEDPPPELGADATTAIYRAAQEALTNVRKHAPGSPVRMRLEHDTETVTLTIANDLPAAATPADPDEGSGGFGLTGLKERAEALGGVLAAGLVEGEWRLSLRIPR